MKIEKSDSRPLDHESPGIRINNLLIASLLP